jgi:hypothetical protein
MLSRQEIITIYEQGLEGVIALVERLFGAIQQQQEHTAFGQLYQFYKP